MTHHDDYDAGDLVRAALEALPADPATATSDDLNVLAAVEEGLSRRTVEAHHALRRLALAVLQRSITTEQALAERDRLDAEMAGLVEADQELTAYAIQAVAACGHDLDALVERAQDLPDRKDPQ